MSGFARIRLTHSANGIVTKALIVSPEGEEFPIAVTDVSETSAAHEAPRTTISLYSFRVDHEWPDGRWDQ